MVLGGHLALSQYSCPVGCIGPKRQSTASSTCAIVAGKLKHYFLAADGFFLPSSLISLVSQQVFNKHPSWASFVEMKKSSEGGKEILG